MLRIIINVAFRAFNLIIIADVIVSYFLSPYQPVRLFLDRIVQPVLEPIRSILPKGMMFDFSPIVLILALEIIQAILLRIV
jgi:YggT family protein